MLGWLRENQVEGISLRESIDHDSAMGRVMLHLAVVFADMKGDLARQRTLERLERVKASGKTSADARRSAESGPSRHTTCASATAWRGAAEPR